MNRARRGGGGRAPKRPASPSHLPPRAERIGVLVLLLLHLALVLWGVRRNSVTFDENFHLPAGVMILARGDYSVSVAQPPLVKSLCALAALAAGARVPPPADLPPNSERAVGEAFMRLNADHYHRIYAAARLPVVALSLLLALLVWRFARRLYGPRGALLSLGLYAFAPEALAHAGLVGMDLPIALGFTAAIYAFWRFARSGSWRWGLAMALAVSLSLLARFSALELGPILILLALIGAVTGRLRRPGRVWLGLALTPLLALALLHVAYRGETSMMPLSRWSFLSPLMQRVRLALPGLELPVPDAAIAGFDYLSALSNQGGTTTYLLGRGVPHTFWYYFPLALLFKWPLGFIAALLARAIHALRFPPMGRRRWNETCLLVPVAVMLFVAMFLTGLDVGVRYLLPIVPLLCIGCGGLALPAARASLPRRPEVARWALAGWLLVAAQAIEVAPAAPWYLSFFNRLSGGPGGGDRLLNDSNVDWGQGLIALEDEMKRLGIARVLLAYHGTTDPAMYGIHYTPYLGGQPGAEHEWLAVSSYYFVGLSQRMMTPAGSTPQSMLLDFRRLWGQTPVAHPAGCMYLFRLR